MNNRSNTPAAQVRLNAAETAKKAASNRLNVARIEFERATRELCPVIEILLCDHDAVYKNAARLQDQARHELDPAVALVAYDEAQKLLEQCRQMIVMRRNLIAQFNLIKNEEIEARANYVAKREAYDEARITLSPPLYDSPRHHSST
ncbi:MAG: hypothetical protein ABIS59_00370 [Candidatus Saccharibacteria bacterium]